MATKASLLKSKLEYITPCLKPSSGFPSFRSKAKVRTMTYKAVHGLIPFSSWFFFLFNSCPWPIPSSCLAIPMIWQSCFQLRVSTVFSACSVLSILLPWLFPVFSTISHSLWILCESNYWMQYTHGPTSCPHSPPLLYFFQSVFYFLTLCLFKMFMAYYLFLLYPHPELSSMSTGIFVCFVHSSLQVSRIEPST